MKQEKVFFMDSSRKAEIETYCEAHNLKVSFFSIQDEDLPSCYFQPHEIKNIKKAFCKAVVLNEQASEIVLLGVWEQGKIYEFSGYEFTQSQVENFDPSRCDHCGKSIRRNKCYIARIEGVETQIGGQCVKYYNLDVKAKDLFKTFLDFEYRFKDESWGFEGFGGRALISAQATMSLASAVIDSQGRYISAKNADFDQMPTSGIVKDIQSKTNLSNDDKMLIGAADSDKTDWVSEAFYWIEKQEKEKGWNSFLSNAKLILAQNDGTQAGVLSYIAFAVKQDKIKAEKEKDGPIAPLNLPEGKTQDIKGSWVVWKKKEFFQEGYYGDGEWKAFLICVNENREGVSVKVAVDKAKGIEEGDQVKIRAGVKGVWKDLLTLTRAKLTKV